MDGYGSIRFLWRQETGGNGSFMFAQMGPLGQPMQNETFITSNVSAPYPVGSPHGDWAAVDSANRIDVVGERDPLNISYEQFDRNGTSTVGPRQVGPADGSLSERPALAIQSDDTVHIASGDYKFQCEDIVYAKLANNGTELWTNRVVSSDVASHTNNSIVRASPFSGNVLFTFGSDSGSWLGRMGRYGVKSMASVKFRNATDGKPADVAETPNGSMHLVWEDGGNLYYAMVNETGVKVVDARVLESNGTVGAFPRVAAAADGRLMVAWEDNRTGSSQILIGEIPRDGNLSAWTSYAVTSTTGAAFDPVVAFDWDDQPIVAWTDTRDGDREIFFKRAAGCSMELYADPIAGMGFLHPNETRVFQLFLKNKALLADSFALDLSYTPSADSLGWRISLDTTYATDVAPGGYVPVNLTIHVPANAKRGDNISIGINATSDSWPGCFDRIDLFVFVQVTRALSLNASPSLQVADNGETVSFPLIAKNTGDIREDLVNIALNGPTAWNLSSDRAELSLDVQESGVFTVSITVPNNTSLAPANFLGSIAVSIWSNADPTVVATRQLLVSIKARLYVNLTVAESDREVRAGACTDFNFTVSNVGNLAGQAQINLEVSSGMAGWTAALDRETVFLRGGEFTDVHGTFCVPMNATPGAVYVRVLNATAIQYGATGEVEFTVRAPPLCRGGVALIATEPPRSGGAAVGTLDISNTGARAQTYAISFSDLPALWGGVARVGGAIVTQVIVEPNTTVTVAAEVTPDARALAGAVPVTVSFTSGECGAYENTVDVVVPPTVVLSLSAINENASAPAGGVAVYEVNVRNDGNTPTGVGFALNLVAQTTGPEWSFEGPDGIRGDPVNQTNSSLIGAFSTLTLRFLVQMWHEPPSREFELVLTATENGGPRETLRLLFSLALPDLLPEGLAVTPPAPVANETASVTVRIANHGGAGSNAGDVRFLIDGVVVGNRSLGPVAANASVAMVFPWLASFGNHTLSIEVRIGDGEVEISTANNFISLTVLVVAPVEGQGQQPPPAPSTNITGPFSPVLAGGLIAGVAAAAALFAVARRRRPGGPPGDS